MLQFLCLQMCMYGGGVVPQGGVGDRHLVTIPQGVVGDRLPWGGERQGGGVPLWALQDGERHMEEMICFVFAVKLHFGRRCQSGHGACVVQKSFAWRFKECAGCLKQRNIFGAVHVRGGT